MVKPYSIVFRVGSNSDWEYTPSVHDGTISLVLVMAITVVIGHLVCALARRSLMARVSKSSAKATARPPLGYAILAIGLYVALWHVLNLDVAGVLVSLGIIGIALAFASQQIVQNAFAGIRFSNTRPL